MVNIYDTYNATHKTKYICQCEIFIDIPNFNVNNDNVNDPMPMCSGILVGVVFDLLNRISRLKTI